MRIAGLFLCSILACHLHADDLAPTITEQSPHQRVDYGDPVTYWVTANGIPTPTYQWQRRTYGGNWRNISGATSSSYTLASTTANDEEANFRCRVSNRAGTVLSHARYLNVLPVFTSQPVLNATVGQPYSYTFATNVPANQVYYSVYSLPDWLTRTGNTLSGTPPATGTVTMRIRARILRPNNGGTGNSSDQRFTIGISPAGNAAPVISAASASPATITGTTTTLSATATDDGGESNLTYTWSAPLADRISNFSFSPNGSNAAKNTQLTVEAPGTYVLRVTAKDQNEAQAYRDISITIANTLSELVFPDDGVRVVAGTEFGLNLGARNQFGHAMALPAVSWSVTDGPGSVDSNGIYRAPANSAGQTATVRASVGNLSAQTRISIIAESIAPRFTSSPPSIVVQGNRIRYAYVAEAVPPIRSYTVSGVPAWMYHYVEGRAIGGTARTLGTHGPITIVASNGVGPDAVQRFTITIVESANDGRVISMDPLPGPRFWEVNAPFTADPPDTNSQRISGPRDQDAVIQPGPANTNG